MTDKIEIAEAIRKKCNQRRYYQGGLTGSEERLRNGEEELSNAHFKKNGCEHSRTFGHYLTKEEFEKQLAYIREDIKKYKAKITQIDLELEQMIG